MEHYKDNNFQLKYPLNKRKIIKKTISTFLLALLPLVMLFPFIFGMIGVAADITNKNYPILFVIISIVFIMIIILLIYLRSRSYYKNYFYNLDDKWIIIRKGVFAPLEITIPYEKIQDVYVSQDILDRYLNIYDVHISTASKSSTDAAHIDGVSRNIAEELRKIILDHAHEKSIKSR